MAASFTSSDVLGFRARAQQLDRETGALAHTAVLDIGVQDTGPDGALWALALRGVDVSALPPTELARVWTIRGAPHLYPRQDLPAVAAAVEPFSDADAGKRIYDASRPLKAAGIGNIAALDTVASFMRSVVQEPMAKGEVSAAVTALVDPPYLRFCRVCDATHLYEMPFRLAALRAGLELEAGTSPPVLRRIAGFEPASTVPEQYDVVRAYLRLLGPATPKQVADYLDAPVKDVKARWPADAVEVTVDDERRWVLAADEPALATGLERDHPAARTVRPVPAGEGQVPAGRRPGPGQGAVADAGQAGCRAARRPDRGRVASAQVRQELPDPGRAVEQDLPAGGDCDRGAGGAAGEPSAGAAVRGGLRRLRPLIAPPQAADRATASR